MYIHYLQYQRSECSCIHGATHCNDIIVQLSEFLMHLIVRGPPTIKTRMQTASGEGLELRLHGVYT